MRLRVRGSRPRLAGVAVTGLAAVAATALAGPASPATHGVRSTRKGSPSCSREVDLGGRHYRLGRLPHGSVKAGARLSKRASLQCEPELVCRVGQACALSAGKVVRKIVARRIQGVSVSLALIDGHSGHVYFNRTIFNDESDPKHLLQQLRRRGGPRPGGSQYPPDSYLPSPPNAQVRLAHGDYCWSSPAANDEFVTGCATYVPPALRFDIPLVAAEPGASLQLHLGFANPTHLHVLLLSRRGKILYAESLDPAQDATWVIPAHLPEHAYLAFEAGRKLAPGAANDYAEYFARLDSLPIHRASDSPGPAFGSEP